MIDDSLITNRLLVLRELRTESIRDQRITEYLSREFTTRTIKTSISEKWALSTVWEYSCSISVLLEVCKLEIERTCISHLSTREVLTE